MTKYISKQDYWKLADAQEFSFYSKYYSQITEIINKAKLEAEKDG